MKRERLHKQVTGAYASYTSNAAIIPITSKYLFRRQLDTRLKADDQYLTCWLRSVNLAMEKQAAMVLGLQERARTFFQPHLNDDAGDDDYHPSGSSTDHTDTSFSSESTSTVLLAGLYHSLGWHASSAQGQDFALDVLFSETDDASRQESSVASGEHPPPPADSHSDQESADFTTTDDESSSSSNAESRTSEGGSRVHQ